MKLKLIDKIMLNNILPSEGNIKTLIILKDLKKKVELAQTDLTDFDIQVTSTGGLQWNDKGREAEFEIEFTELEKIEVKLAIKKLDKENKLSIDTLNLVELFGVTNE